MSSPANEYLARAREAEASARKTDDVALKAHFLKVAKAWRVLAGLSRGPAANAPSRDPESD
jgi:predicted lipoprotein